jgi:hypothetical protein
MLWTRAYPRYNYLVAVLFLRHVVPESLCRYMRLTTTWAVDILALDN